jgi:hypothetical protein
MSVNHAVGHGIKHLLKDLPRLERKKNPFIAGMLGFFFGGVGLGLYFQSWKDFVYPVLIFIGLSIVFPGLGTLTAIIFTAIWGVVRAVDSGR